MRARRFQHQSVNKKAPTKTYFLTDKKENDFPYDFVTSPKRRWIEVQCCHYGYDDNPNLPRNIIMHCSFIKRDPYVDQMVFFCNPPHGKRTKHKKYEYTSPEDHFTIWFTNPIPQRRAVQALPPRTDDDSADWIYRQYDFDHFHTFNVLNFCGTIPRDLVDKYYANINAQIQFMRPVTNHDVQELNTSFQNFKDTLDYTGIEVDPTLLPTIQNILTYITPTNVNAYQYIANCWEMFLQTMTRTLMELYSNGDPTLARLDWMRILVYMAPTIVSTSNEMVNNSIFDMLGELYYDTDYVPVANKPEIARYLAYLYMFEYYPEDNSTSGHDFFTNVFATQKRSYKDIKALMFSKFITRMIPDGAGWNTPVFTSLTFDKYFPTFMYLFNKTIETNDEDAMKEVCEVFYLLFQLDLTRSEPNLLKVLRGMNLNTRYPKANSVLLYLIGNFLHANNYPGDVWS